MKLLDKLVLKDLIPFFLTGVALFSAIFFAADPVLTASRYLSQGVPLWLVLQVVSEYIPYILGLTLPMGMLLAVLQGFGRLSGESESVALFAAGIPFRRIVVPAIMMGVLASGVGFVINDKFVSAANQQKVDLQNRIGAIIATGQHKPRPGDGPQPLDYRQPDAQGGLEALIHAENVDPATNTLYNVTVQRFDRGDLVETIQAARAQRVGTSDFKHWRVYDAYGYRYDHQHRVEGYAQGDALQSVVAGVLDQTPADVSLLNREADTLDFVQSRRRIALMRAAGFSRADVRAALYDFWTRIALPLSALIFTVIGSPLGLRPQRSSRITGWFLAILIIFGYYVFYTAMGFAARGGAVAPALAAFLPDLAGLAIGAALVWRASR